jgi:hypothetical protein
MLRKAIRGALILVLLTTGTVAQATQEHYRYSWRLRGGLAWIAKLAFPTSGVGELKNVPRQGKALESQLLITSPGSRDGYYLYRSEIDQGTHRTLMSYHAYAWGSKSKNERTLFDYDRLQAHIREEDEKQVENRVKPLPGRDMRDVLTGIHYLRHNADRINAPLRADIYSDGKLYPVVFKPAERLNYSLNGQSVPARSFVITAAPGAAAKKWPGGIKVWLSEDDRRVPLRIEINRGLASLQLDLKSIG